MPRDLALCHHFEAGRCRSCSWLGTPYDAQLVAKQRLVEEVVGSPAQGWLPPVASAGMGFRNKAKMVVHGTVEEPTLGILGPTGSGVDLRDCPLHTAGIRAALPVLAGFVTRAGLTPYDAASVGSWLHGAAATLAGRGGPLVAGAVASAVPDAVRSLPTP